MRYDIGDRVRYAPKYAEMLRKPDTGTVIDCSLEEPQQLSVEFDNDRHNPQSIAAAWVTHSKE